MLRLLRHYHEYQREVNRSILARVSATETQCAALAAGLKDVLKRSEHSTDVLDPISVQIRACESSLHALGVTLAQLRKEHDSRSTGLDNMVSRLARTAFPFDVAGDAGTGPDLEPWLATLRSRWAQQANRPIQVRSSSAVRLETELGALLYPADDQVVTPWVAHHGSWEKDECRIWESILQPGMTFIDVGAHVGYLALVGARSVGPTGYGIALEPWPENFRLLCANLIWSGVINVEPIHAAAWRRSGYVHLQPSTENSGDHRVSENPGRDTVLVAALAIDDVIPPTAEVHAVKVDTQGRDHVVIEGMAGIIHRHRPVILVEFWPEGILDLGDDPERVISFYRSLQLRIELVGSPVSGTISNAAVVEWALSRPGGYGTVVLSPVERAPILSPEGMARSASAGG
jgi:FkbM family methyltransferase